MIIRILSTIFIFIAILTTSWWIYVPFLFISAIIFRLNIEALILSILAYALYPQVFEYLWLTPIVISIILLIREKLIDYLRLS